MKVAVLHDHLRFIGGGERVALTLASAFDADLYVTDLDPTLPGRAGMPHVRVHEIARVPQRPPMRQDRQARAFTKAMIPDHDAYVFSGSDLAKLSEFRVGLQKAVAAIQATMDDDGLAWQNPRIKTKLLMDQAQAYAGLRRAHTVATALGDSSTARLAKQLADQIENGVASMWNPGTQMYAKSKDENGNLAATTWNQYYMDSTAQAWVVGFGNIPPQKPLINASRAKDLVDDFVAAWPEWTDPFFTVGGGDPRVMGTGDGAINYWPMIALAFFDVGRKPDGVAGVDAIEAAAVSAGRTWPFTVGHAGEIIRVRGA